MGQKKPKKFFWLSAGVNDWGDLDGNLILMKEREWVREWECVF